MSDHSIWLGFFVFQSPKHHFWRQNVNGNDAWASTRLPSEPEQLSVLPKALRTRVDRAAFRVTDPADPTLQQLRPFVANLTSSYPNLLNLVT